MLANAGVLGGVYYYWKPFSPVEVRQFIAFYILQGLSHSPQNKMKFVPQHEDPINGSNICFKVFERKKTEGTKCFSPYLPVKIL